MTTPSVASNRRRIVPAVLLVLLIAIGVGVWYFLVRDDSPEAFSIDDATSGVVADDGAGSTDDATPDGVDGTWTIDPDAGAEAGGSSAGYRVDEVLAQVGDKTVVGRTPQVEGSLTISGTTVDEVSITVDLASIETDSANRDSRMRSALATDEFPTATFVTTEPIELDAIPAEGETISITAVGDMTIKGVTKSIEAPLEAQVVDGTLVIVGSIPVVFADYDVETPSAAIVVSLDDNGTIEFQLYLTRS